MEPSQNTLSSPAPLAAGAQVKLASVPPGEAPLITTDGIELTAGHVLVVDDVPANVRLLAGILKVAGYEVSTATNGAEALAKIAQRMPEVVLLDVMMPDMDGFEVCRRIKTDSVTALLPVVMVTALQSSTDRVNALEAGADDFLTKPVDNLEVAARVKSLVCLKRQRDELEHAYQELQRVEALRENLVTMLVHDLRTPLTGILSPLEMLSDKDFGQLDPMQRELINICRKSSYNLLALINQLLDINKMESGEMKLERQPLDLSQLVDNAMQQVATLARDRDTQIIIHIPPDLPPVPADSDLLQRVLVNLAGNAIKFSPPESQITIAAQQLQISSTESEAEDATQDFVLISAQDNGPGIPPEDRQRIFDKFGQVEGRKAGRKTSTGLGLSFCKLTVEAHGGRIWVESEPDQGSTFKFTLPMSI